MTEQEAKAKAEAFSKDYLELCKKHKLQIAFNPLWKQSMDTGTYSMVIQTTLAEYVAPPEPEKTA
jgi:hypothetical protein